MTVLETLIAARATIANPINWAVGIRKWPNNQGGFKYCALGAIDATGIQEPQRLWQEAINLLSSCLTQAEIDEAFDLRSDDYRSAYSQWPVGRVARFNNTHSHEQVLSWFDRAIAKASQEQTQPAVDAIKADALKGAAETLVSLEV